MKFYVFIFFLALIGCSQSNDSTKSLGTMQRQVVSFSGDLLPTKQLVDSTKLRLEDNLAFAKDKSGKFPGLVEFAIWQGRRMAYLGRYFEAIEFYSEAIRKFPRDHRLYRHRGHRYISTRQLEKAILDFEKGTDLAERVPNRVEPDGIPNKLNRPTGNDRFNIYYHHGLALYLQGRFNEAIPVYQKCMTVSRNNDLLVATSYWLYMTLHRVGELEKANALLTGINSEMEIIENEGYRDLLLLFAGNKTPQEITETAKTTSGVGNPTLMYGLGNYYLQQGDAKKAQEIWAELLNSPSWDAFGYIAAEAEITIMKLE